MKIQILTESYFGNTSAVAQAVADGLRSRGATVSVAEASSAPDLTGADLVVIGAPTHNMGLPKSASRTQAAQSGGAAASTGVSEWLASAALPPPARAAAFDTVTGTGFFSGSAAKAVRKQLRRSGVEVVACESFVVAGREGPLQPGEIERAAAWGRDLADLVLRATGQQ